MPARIATHRKSPLEFQTHDISGRRFADCPGGKPDYLRFDQLFEILPGQSNQFSMGACVKCNLLILRQAFIRKDLDAVEISERWHGARFTIGEPVFEFALGGELSSCRHCFRLKSSQIDMKRGRKNGHHQRIVRLDHNRFCQLLPRNMARAAIPCAVKAGEWEMTMYLTL